MRSRAHSVLSDTVYHPENNSHANYGGGGGRGGGAAEEPGAVVKINNPTRCWCIDLIGCGLTSLGGVKVPSTSNRQRMFRSDEKLFDFSISSSLLSASLVYKLHC